MAGGLRVRALCVTNLSFDADSPLLPGTTDPWTMQNLKKTGSSTAFFFWPSPAGWKVRAGAGAWNDATKGSDSHQPTVCPLLAVF